MEPGVHYTTEGNLVTPDENYNGTLYIESYFRDPQGATSTVFYLEILINSVNDPPVFTSIPPDTVKVENQYIYSIKVDDPDEGDILTYSVSLKPAWITFYPNSKLLAGTPHQPDVGNTAISIRVNDGHVNIDQSYVLHVDGPTPVADLSGSGIFLYPNPARDHIVISRNEKDADMTFDLFDLTGRQVLSKSFCSSCEAVIQFRDYKVEPGSYVYRITQTEKSVSGTLMIRE
jgi:hypothetical protein